MGRKGTKRVEAPKIVSRPEMTVEEEIDLHGLAIDEAMVQVELALSRWRNRPGSCIRIVHGQSSGSKDSIKGMLRWNLETRWKNRVRAFRQEPGNPGATLVFPAA